MLEGEKEGGLTKKPYKKLYYLSATIWVGFSSCNRMILRWSSKEHSRKTRTQKYSGGVAFLWRHGQRGGAPLFAEPCEQKPQREVWRTKNFRNILSMSHNFLYRLNEKGRNQLTALWLAQMFIFIFGCTVLVGSSPSGFEPGPWQLNCLT